MTNRAEWQATATPTAADLDEPRLRTRVVDTAEGPVTLVEDEELVDIHRSPLVLPEEPEPPMQVLLRMCSVASEAELGKVGPAIASLANEENADNPELRRYEAVFGRDSLYTASFLRHLYPQLEEGTVRYLAAYQATRYDERSLAEPGKIANHIRDPNDPLARRLTAETGRRWPWFGGTDTTVLFILACSRLARRRPGVLHDVVLVPRDRPRAGAPVMRDGVPLTLRTVLRDAAAWLRTELEDESVPGLLWCYLNRKDSYTVWTDSPNAFHHASGRIPPPPVAPVALQAEAFDAASALAELAEHEPGLGVEPDEARAWARRLRELVLAEAVVETPKGPFLANGLVAEGEQKRLRPLAVRTVGMGIALDSDLLRGPDAAAVREGIVQHLSSPAMTSPFGIVGRARDEVRYTPFDYHAQVWAFASYRVAAGLRHHGFEEAAIDLEDRILRQTRDGLLPENVGAGPEDELRYCAHLLTVRRPAADGRITETVKERPPAPYAAWTTGAVIAITQGRGGVQQHDD